jgi:hypothetical protein
MTNPKFLSFSATNARENNSSVAPYRALSVRAKRERQSPLSDARGAQRGRRESWPHPAAPAQQLQGGQRAL